jgi:hypothetical protein
VTLLWNPEAAPDAVTAFEGGLKLRGPWGFVREPPGDTPTVVLPAGGSLATPGRPAIARPPLPSGRVTAIDDETREITLRNETPGDWSRTAWVRIGPRRHWYQIESVRPRRAIPANTGSAWPFPGCFRLDASTRSPRPKSGCMRNCRWPGAISSGIAIWNRSPASPPSPSKTSKCAKIAPSPMPFLNRHPTDRPRGPQNRPLGETGRLPDRRHRDRGRRTGGDLTLRPADCRGLISIFCGRDLVSPHPALSRSGERGRR